MRLLLVLFVLFSLTAPGAARAEDNYVQPPPEENVQPLDEYNNVPPGMLMSSDAAQTPQDGTAKPDEEVMTMADLADAYNKQQYDLVAKHIIPIANSNYPQAQELLGIMYHNGQGVHRDPQSALEYLTKAAEAGRPLAQHHLAIINFIGDGVPRDAVKAMMWLNIAIAHYQDGPEKTRALQDRDNVAAQLSRRDKSRARELAREWLSQRNDPAILDEDEK